MSDNPTCPQFPARPPHGGEPFIVPPAPRRKPGLSVLSVNGRKPDGHGDLALTYIDGAEYAAGYGDPPRPALLFRQGGEVVAVVDATPLLKDGMVSSVAVSGGNLVVTFNTDAGKEPVEIPLTSIFNPENYYDKVAADGRFALKGEMSVAAGTGADADKTTITLRPGVLATVLSAHQPLDAYFNAAEYDSANRKILLKHGSVVKAQIDAAAFIKDGMVSSVAISSGKLVVTFNTDAGQEPIEIPLTDIFNPANYYDRTTTNTLLSGKADTVANATYGHFAALTSTGNLVDSGKKAADFAADNAVVKLTGGTMSGNLKFVGGDGQAIGVEVEYHGADDVSTVYAGDSIFRTIGSSSSYLYLFPNETGTLALTSDIPNISGKADKADVAAAATAATNYTDSAIGAAIAPANPTFSNAVLSVGLGVDTNTVAAINALVEAGDELPIGGAATVGGLLLALAAAVAALKRTKADASALRYAMPASVALVAENDAATLVCADRAVTNATIASGFSTLNLTFPAEVSGYVRDFYLRITVAAGESAPAISLPQGITIENAGGAVPEIADGEASAAATTLVWFSETAPGVFTAKSETVKAVV